MPNEVAICKLDDLTAGIGRFVVTGDRELAVFLLDDGSVYAVDNTCPHMGGNLAGGQVHRGVVVCPLHNWPFDLRTGRCPDSPDVGVASYPTEVRNGTVYADLDPDESTDPST